MVRQATGRGVSGEMYQRRLTNQSETAEVTSHVCRILFTEDTK